MMSPGDELHANYEPLDGVRLNMVINARGETSGSSNTSEAISNPIDRQLLRHLRSISSVVITDAATAAAERYGPSRLVEIEVWSKSGDFRGLQSSPASQELFALSHQLISDEVSRLGTLTRKYKRVLLETGPTLTTILAEHQLVDEACITVTRAEDEKAALVSLMEFVKRIGLDYLQVVRSKWVEGALFATLRR